MTGISGKYRLNAAASKKTTAIKDTPKCGGAEWNKTRARNKPFHLKAVHFSNHKAWVPVASERIWAFNAFLPFIHGTDDFIQDDTPLQQFRGLAGQAYERRGVSFKAESRSIARTGGGDWAMKTYAFLGLIVNSQLSLATPPCLWRGEKKSFPMLLSYFYLHIFDLTVGLHC